MRQDRALNSLGQIQVRETLRSPSRVFVHRDATLR